MNEHTHQQRSLVLDDIVFGVALPIDQSDDIDASLDDIYESWHEVEDIVT